MLVVVVVVVVVAAVVIVVVLLARLVEGKIGRVVVPFSISQYKPIIMNKNCLNYLIIRAGIHLSIDLEFSTVLSRLKRVY